MVSKKKLVIPPRTEKSLRRLPVEIQRKFFEQADRLFENPFHPSLRHKRVQGVLHCWEFSITMNYRAVYRRRDDDYEVILIGKHEDVF